MLVAADSKIAHYKIPRYVRIVDTFPTTASGKIRKVDMRRIDAEQHLRTT